MKKVSILLLSTLAFGCQHAPQQQQPAPGMLPKYHVAAPLSLFSTYPSDTMQSLCSDISIGSSPCTEDALEGHLFVKALSESNWFDRILPASSEADYELLIASLASDLPTSDSALSLQTLTAGLWNEDTTTHYFTELTVQWRGIEIASEIFDTVRQPDQSDEKLVDDIMRKWWLGAIANEVFSAEYLFEKLGASNYQRDMVIPQNIAEFELLDTQLYPDPFKGVISRYTHPEFEGALLDIAVSPVMANLALPADDRLKNALNINLREAQQMAEHQAMALSIDGPVSPFAVAVENKGKFNGYRMAIHAESDDAEPIFATTYAFEMEDKLVTISTTFPPRIADSLVASALPLIKVPGPSPLMQTLRSMQSAASQQ